MHFACLSADNMAMNVKLIVLSQQCHPVFCEPSAVALCAPAPAMTLVSSLPAQGGPGRVKGAAHSALPGTEDWGSSQKCCGCCMRCAFPLNDSNHVRAPSISCLDM